MKCFKCIECVLIIVSFMCNCCVFSNNIYAYAQSDSEEVELSGYSASVFAVADAYKVQCDMNHIKSHPELISSESFDKLTKSLDFNVEAPYGSKIAFTSHNEDVITPLGRVIRPRFDEDAVTADVTVSVSSGTESAEYDIEFTVLPDEKFEEPSGYMSDEEFFGRYETGKWIVVPKLNYEKISSLKDVESAAKSGDYALAGKEFLKYIKAYKSFSGTLSDSNRKTLRASAYIDGIYDPNGGSSLVADFSASGNEWNEYAVPIGSVAKSAINTYVVMAWYNESAPLEIKSKESGTSPYIEAKVNGVTKKFYAIADATIRAGKEADASFGEDDVLYARTFGDYMGDDAMQTLLKFDFSDVKLTDSVTDAKLVVTARIDSESNSFKKMLVCTNSHTAWEENTVCWNDFSWFMYNFNGNDYNWERPLASNIEFSYKMNCFNEIYTSAYEYACTKDEAYAYGVIKTMLDWIEDKSTSLPISHYDGIWTGRGQYPRSLDTAERIKYWLWAVPYVTESKYMTEKEAVAIWKHLWDAMNATRMNHNKGAYNWQQNELMNLFTYSMSLNEFSESSEWADYANQALLGVATSNVYGDGSYVEGSDSYASGALTDFIDHKKYAEQIGYKMGPAFNNMLLKFAWWQLMLEQPTGGFVGYGDSEMASTSLESSTSERFADISSWYNDDEFKYVASYGAKGVEPKWTSKIWRDSGTSVLRSSWSRDAMYIFTNVNGRSNHSHSDDNHIFFSAYGRQLLTDPGLYYTYGSKDIQSWGQMRNAHNTVSMDGSAPNATINQVGTIDDFITNSSIDFHSSTSVSHADYRQKRSILMVKPHYVIVSDYLVPTDSEKINTYHQNWHMLPQANISADAVNKTLRSNFDSGANIVLANADNSNTQLLDGYQSYNGSSMETEYGSFSVSGKGDVTIDTAFSASENDKNPVLKVERINLGVDTTTATSIKITSESDGSKHTGYYYLSYENSPVTERTFGKYASNGMLAFADEDSEGNVKIASMAEASFIKKDNKYLVYSDKRLSDLTINLQGSELMVESGEDDLGTIKFSDEFDVEYVLINGERYGFSLVDGYIVPGVNPVGVRLYENDFDSADSVDSEFIAVSGGGNWRSQHLMTSAVYGNEKSDKCVNFRFSSGNSYNDFSEVAYLTEHSNNVIISDKTLKFSFSLAAESNNFDVAGLMVGQGLGVWISKYASVNATDSDSLGAVGMTRNGIYAFGEKLMDYEVGKWYNFDVIIYGGTNRYDVYINNIPIRENGIISSVFCNIARTALRGYSKAPSGSVGTINVYFDDVLAEWYQSQGEEFVLNSDGLRVEVLELSDVPVKCDVSISVRPLVDVKRKLIVASYEGDTLTGIDMQTSDCCAGKNTTLTASLTLQRVDFSTTVKCFLWGDGVKPIKICREYCVY